MKIPKIIHQTSPADTRKHPLTWTKCHESWKKEFPSPEFQHMMWSDEDLELFIKKDFDWFHPYYEGYPHNIERIDMARYFILFKYGGIYADMDYYCNKKFYSFLPGDCVSIARSPYPINETLQNCLMASPPNDPFWLDVFKLAVDDYIVYVHPNDSTGPRFLDRVHKKTTCKINILPTRLYNPAIDSDAFLSDEVYTKHYVTSVWTDNPALIKKRDDLFKQ